MSQTRNILMTGMVVLLALAGNIQSAHACAACYGETGNPMSTGLTWGITVLVGVVSCVLAGVVAFFVHTVRHTPPAPTGESATREDAEL